jgi:hypothetical protein
LGVVGKNDAIFPFLLDTTGKQPDKNSNDREIAGGKTTTGFLRVHWEQAKAYIDSYRNKPRKVSHGLEANRINVLSWFNKQQMQLSLQVSPSPGKPLLTSYPKRLRILLTGWHGWPRILYPKLYWKWN